VLRENGVEASAYRSISEALIEALENAKRDKVALVCLGSLYTYVSIIDKIERFDNGRTK
jgi:hypothetical protein